MSTIEAYITDFDGTLCDTKAANISAYSQAFKDADLTFDEALYVEHFGHRFDEMMDVIAPNTSEEQREVVKKQKALHYTTDLHLVSVNDSLVEILRTAKEAGKKIGLATTARRQNVEAILSHFSLLDLFDEMIFGEDVTKSKPDPECYTLIVERLGIAPENCIVFEDSSIGIAAAEAAGTHVLKVTL